MRIGWLADSALHMAGGAEYEMLALWESAPDDVEIVLCPPDGVSPEVDAYVVHNCVSYGRDIIPRLALRPVIKRVHDLWPQGDPALRRWLLTHSTRVLLSTPLQADAMLWQIDAPTAYLPSAVDLGSFQAANRHDQQREGVVWVGRLVSGKGLTLALQWALRHEMSVDVYGFGPLAGSLRPPLHYRGWISPTDLPETLARYETFLFLPDAVEPFGRTVVEARAAGCRLIVNGNVGACWWIEEDPAAIERAAARFWQHVREVVT